MECKWSNGERAVSFLCHFLLFCTATLHHKPILTLCWCVPLSPPDQVRDAGRILREWRSRGKRQICTVITVMTPLVMHWHLVTAWPHYIETFSLNLSPFQSVAFILTHISLLLSCNHTDTCLTPRSLVAETNRHSTYSLPCGYSITHLSCLSLWILPWCG